MSNHLLLYQVVLFYITAHFTSYCSGQHSTYYLDGFPANERKTINLPYTKYDSSIILQASTKTYPFIGAYSLTVKVPNDEVFDTFRIQGTVQKFGLRNNDRLIITSTSGGFNDTIYDSKFMTKIPKSFYTEKFYNRALIFELELRSTSEKLKAFEITLTSARYCLVSLNTKYDEFYCSNAYCIKDYWKCNDRDNCGNKYDERGSLCSKGFIIGFSIGGVLLFVALVAGCVIICRRRYGRPTTLTTSTVIVSPRSNIYPGSQIPVPNPVPPGTYLYNTNPANWQQFQDQTAPPPPYSGVMNQPFNYTYPQNQQRY